RTPIVRLDKLSPRGGAQILAKLEYLNPGGSVKDRIGLPMIEAAEREGKLKPGGTIVEPTSGNTGVGLAIAAAIKGYRCIFVMPDKMSQEKIALLRAYGAEVVVCPTTVAPDHPDSYYSVARRLAAEIPGAFQPDQYHNQANPAAHEASTGPEIWRQTAGRVTHVVIAIGTGGTITGVGRYLKAQNPDLQVIGADPEGSVYSGGSGRPYLVEGIGEWMADFGLLRAGGQTVADLLLRKAPELPALVHVHPDETVRAAIDLLREYDVSQLPVVKAEPPLAAAEVMGSVHERDLMEQAFRDPAVLDRPVAEHMGPPLPTIGSGEAVDL